MVCARTCGQPTVDRTLVVELHLDLPAGNKSASLSQGTLLIGQAKGRMIVWQQLH